MASTNATANGSLPQDSKNLRPAAASRGVSQQSSNGSFKSVSSQPQEQETPASSSNSTEVEKQEEWKLPTDGPLKTPIPKPLSGQTPPAETKLTAEQETKYATVLGNASQWTTLPASTAKNAPQTPIQEHERMWLTRECILRYLRATKWDTGNAIKRLQSTLSWRREYGADTFTFDYISPENETGKQVIVGYDIQARPCLYLSPGKQNTEMSDRQIHHLCFMLDRVVDMMPAGQENAALLINFKGAKSGKVPTVGQARQVLTILQSHNPERLGRALISELPWYVNTFFKLISPFIDPVTREKMKFNEDLRQWVPPSELWKEGGGDLNFEYDHQAYWTALEKMTTKRREAYRQRWEKAGKQLGEYEEYLRGGNHHSIKEEAEKNKKEGNPVSDTDADLAAAGVGKMSVS